MQRRTAMPRVMIAFALSFAVMSIAAIGVRAQTASPAAPPSPATAPAASKPTSEQQLRDRVAEILATAIDRQHGGDAWRQHAVALCDFTLVMGETRRAGRLAIATNRHATRIDFDDGVSLANDGGTITTSGPRAPSAESAAAQLFGWRRMFAAPFIARESNTQFSTYRATSIMGGDADSCIASSTTAPDSPDFVLYADARTRVLKVVASEDLPSAVALPDSANLPRAIALSEPVTVEGATIPTVWTLFDWTTAAGMRGDALGTITISNLRFALTDQVHFTAGVEMAASQPTSSPNRKPN